MRRHLENHVTYGLQIGKGVQVIVTVLFLGLLSLGYLSPDLGFRSDPFLLWNNHQVVAQKQALTWVKDHLSPSDTIITDNYLWTDLHDPTGNTRAYKRAHYYWKVDTDPAIRDHVFHKNWRTADYIVNTYQVQFDARNAGLGLVSSALEHSRTVASFDTDGFEVTVRRVNKNVPEPKSGATTKEDASSSQSCKAPL